MTAGFAAGALVATSDGLLPVEHLTDGDKVVTRDNGLCPLRGLRARDAGGAPLCRVAASRETPDAPPSAPLIMAPRQQVLLQSPWLSLLYGLDDALAAIAHMGDAVRPHTPEPNLRLFEIALEAPALALVGGVWCALPALSGATLELPRLAPWEAQLLERQVAGATRTMREAA